MSMHVTIFSHAGIWCGPAADAAEGAADRPSGQVQEGQSRHVKIWLSFTWGYLDRRRRRRDRAQRFLRTMVEVWFLSCMFITFKLFVQEPDYPPPGMWKINTPPPAKACIPTYVSFFSCYAKFMYVFCQVPTKGRLVLPPHKQAQSL